MTARAPLAALLVVVAIASTARAERRVSVLIDTSGSMLRNDAPLYTVQLAKILADLTEPGDRYQVTRLPPSSSEVDVCNTPPTPALRLAMRPGDYAGFKGSIERFVGRYTGGNKFAGSIHSALDLLTLDSSHQRLLLFLADSGGLSDECETSLTKELKRFRDSGGMVAAVNIGSSTGGFGGNPAFNFTRAARSSADLVEAVAEVYQRFLGSREAKTGRLNGGAVEVEIGPYVKEAFLVVAADGEFSALTPASGNPSAKTADLNLRGGGSTKGLDGRNRSYRIARITHPEGGRWRFQAGSAAGGWMLLEESAIAIRPLETVSSGPQTRVMFEVFDERTGERITSGDIPSLTAEVEVEGQRLTLRDDGSGGDESEGDGILTGTARLPTTGRRQVSAVLRGGDLERRMNLTLDVREPGWNLSSQTPARAEIGVPIRLRARAEAQDGGSTAGAPAYVTARIAGGAPMRLEAESPGVYGADWTPNRTGELAVRFDLPPEAHGKGAEGTIEVLGLLSFSGPPPTVKLGPIKSGEEASGTLDLSAVEVEGEVRATLETDLDLSNADLLVQTDAGWVSLDKEPKIRLRSGSNQRLALRLTAAACPTACSPDEPHEIALQAPRADGSVVELRAPLQVEVIGDPFLACYWQYLVAALATVLGGVIVYGFTSPSRFNARDGLQLAQEADLEEGFFHPFRTQRGSRAGFYRDARLYLSADYRLSGSKNNALVRLRADKGRVKIQPASGQMVWRETIDGDWEELPPEETPLRTGVVYRNDDKSVYFDFRTGG